MSEAHHEKLLRTTYAAFNDRDIDGVLSTFSPEVDWPNAWEGGRVIGHEAVRDYWTRQWEKVDPTVEPISFTHRSFDTVAVEVHQLVRDQQGNALADGRVLHVYVLKSRLVRRMDIEEISAGFRSSSGAGLRMVFG